MFKRYEKPFEAMFLNENTLNTPFHGPIVPKSPTFVRHFEKEEEGIDKVFSGFKSKRKGRRVLYVA